MLADANYSLGMMHYGAAQPKCYWGVGHEEGIFTRLFPDEVAHQQAGKKRHGKRKQDQERPGQDGRGLEDHLAHGLKLAASGQERGRLDVDRGQNRSDRRVHWRVHVARLGWNDRRRRHGRYGRVDRHCLSNW